MIVALLHHLARTDRETPFDERFLDESYASLSDACRERGMDLIIAHSYHDGAVEGWRHHANWDRASVSMPNLLMLKIAPSRMPPIIEDTSLRGIRIINHPDMDRILNDKLRTYAAYPDRVPTSIPTRNSTLAQDIGALRSSRHHPDFDTDTLFIKPIQGSGGEGIIIATDTIPTLPDGDFIIQPRIHARKRFESFTLTGSYDCRLVIHDGRIVHAYLRVSNDRLVSNAAKGGLIIYIPLEQIPTDAWSLASRIDASLERYGPRIYSIDFIIGISGTAWVIEMNAQPGLVWSGNDQKVREARILHEAYAQLFSDALILSSRTP